MSRSTNMVAAVWAARFRGENGPVASVVGCGGRGERGAAVVVVVVVPAAAAAFMLKSISAMEKVKWKGHGKRRFEMHGANDAQVKPIRRNETIAYLVVFHHIVNLNGAGSLFKGVQGVIVSVLYK